MSPSAETVPLLVERDAAPDARDGETSAVASRRGRASRALFIAAGSSPRGSQLARLAPQCAPSDRARGARGVSRPGDARFFSTARQVFRRRPSRASLTLATVPPRPQRSHSSAPWLPWRRPSGPASPVSSSPTSVRPRATLAITTRRTATTIFTTRVAAPMASRTFPSTTSTTISQRRWVSPPSARTSRRTTLRERFSTKIPSAARAPSAPCPGAWETSPTAASARPPSSRRSPATKVGPRVRRRCARR